MPANPPAPTADRYGRFVDSASGLVVPETYQRRAAQLFMTQMDSAITATGFNTGFAIDRDRHTLAARFPAKGSGLDDLVTQALVDGEIANVGVSPVVAPQISAMVRRQQNQADSASIELTGRKTPTGRAREAISRFNDSPLGATDALEHLVYGLCTYNRGAPIATVPITYDMAEWERYGLNAVPLVGEGESEADATKFYLEVDWSRFGTPTPYLPSVFDLEPTGVQEFPYWYHVKRGDRWVWVLLHHSQIIPITPGKSAKPGIGTSPVWMCLGYLAEEILIKDERIEKMLYALTDGIILLGGVHELSGDKIKAQVEKGREEAIERGYAVAKGSTIITSPLDKVSYVQINFRQPSGIDFKEWREYTEDITAFCFGEPLSTMVVRGGVGYGAQAEEAGDNAADSGIGAMLHKIATALGAIYPRVQVTITRPNDRAQRLNIGTLATFASAMSQLPEGTLSQAEIRAIIDRDILTIPQADVGTVSTSANADDDSSDEGVNAGANGATLEAAALIAELGFATLYTSDGVEITDDDVDQAIEEEVDDVQDFLNAALEEDGA
ncbi:MAG: hypothetical protein IPK17_38555 [Chloroflexi bacterium]|uniref:hypothetical protein n=1 Tax=Candidatus Flexifilum breve TaxID=3140694 RepID=UPI0031349AE8|nr:hypothetical protein [Chloroflexota bacterium]